MTPHHEPYSESVFFLILNLARRMRATLEDHTSEIGVSVPEYIALMVLNSVGPISNASLARHCSISPQAMMKVTSRLVAAELVTRAPSAEQRQHLLALTPAGASKVEEIVVRLKGIVNLLAVQEGVEQYRAFKRLLAIYWEALGPDDEPAGGFAELNFPLTISPQTDRRRPASTSGSPRQPRRALPE